MDTKSALDAFFGKPATNTATNTYTYNDPEKNPVENVGDVATNAADLQQGMPHQRWDRDKYNSYQREYMKVWRAVRAGRAERIGG